MTMLYPQTVQHDILFIDATGSLVKQSNYLNSLLYYAAVIRHPFNLSPPMPIAEFISSNQDQYAIRNFLNTIHEKEFHLYGANGVTNPKLITRDFSMALI